MARYDSPSEEVRDYSLAAQAGAFGLFAGAIIGIIISMLLIALYLKLAYSFTLPIFTPALMPKNIHFLQTHVMYNILFSTYIKYTTIFFAVVTCVLAGYFGSKKKSSERVTKGRKAIANTDEAYKLAEKTTRKMWDKKNGTRGICIYPAHNGKPAIFLPLRSETLHFFYSGMTGAGKTQAIQWLLRHSIQRKGDKVVAYDFKGDLTEMYADMIEAGTAILLAPWDTRSMRWNIQDDMTRITDAGQISASLIPKDPKAEEFWSKSSRDIMTAVLTALKYEAPEGWTFKHLSWLFSNIESLSLAIGKYRPNAAIHIKGDSDQSQGVLSSIRAAGENYDILAKMWGDESDGKGFSFVPWLHGKSHKKVKLVIISGNSNYSEIYNGVIASMLSVAMHEVAGMPESDDRRIWCFLDELGQLGGESGGGAKITFLPQALTVGRSKGLRIVMGIQDIGAIQVAYGEKLAETIAGQAGTFFCGLQSGENAKWSSNVFGSQTVERYSQTIQPNNSNNQSVIAGDSASSTWQKNEQPCVTDGELAALTASESNNGPTLFCKIAGINDKIFKLHFPYIATPKTGPAVIERTDFDDLPILPPDHDYVDDSGDMDNILSKSQQQQEQESHTQKHEDAHSEEHTEPELIQQQQQESGQQEHSEEGELGQEVGGEALDAMGGGNIMQLGEFADLIFSNESTQNNIVTSGGGGGKKKKRRK